jgi:hypothetical protein
MRHIAPPEAAIAHGITTRHSDGDGAARLTRITKARSKQSAAAVI